MQAGLCWLVTAVLRSLQRYNLATGPNILQSAVSSPRVNISHTATQTHRHTMTIICKSHFTNDHLASSDQHTTQLFADTGGNVDFSQV